MSTGHVESNLGLFERPPDFDAPGTAVADTPERQRVTTPSENRVSGPTGSPRATPSSDTDVQWANSELLTLASSIEQIQSRLAEANARLSQASKVEATEVEIGRLFVEAQRFSEDSLARLEHQVHEVLREAEVKARQIIAEATEEAHEIRRQAHQSAFISTKAAQDLQTAIAGFTGVNSALIKELGTLNSMLTPEEGRAATEIEALTPPATVLEQGSSNGSRPHSAGSDHG